MTIHVQPSKLTEVCERAARFHRLQVAGRSTPFLLEQEVFGLPTFTEITIGPDGWENVGRVVDGVENLYLAVWWNPELDKVCLEKPTRQVIPIHEPVLSTPPLYKTPQVSSKALTRPFTALSGYIYTYEGQKNSAEEAELMTAELGTLDGWTWRPEPR